ncbi:MAG TPA: GNAT family protein [Acidimicrobiales bacterium]|nr:GNAT family protein [Acidimicrobiales bacterium]
MRHVGGAATPAGVDLTPRDLGQELRGRRVTLRPLRAGDYRAWLEVRTRAREWLVHWEPRRAGAPYLSEDRSSFVARCSMRERDHQLGTAFSFGIFVGGSFVGEINLSSIQRGASQSAYLGYWVDEAHAGRGYVPESCVVVFGFAFSELSLHRVQVAIIPRNRPSRRVAEKLGLVEEGLARGYLEIDGVWEDHVRYAITSEDWAERREAYEKDWLGSADA